MMRANKKVIFLGLLIVVLGLWFNSTLGYEEDFPASYNEAVEYVE